MNDYNIIIEEDAEGLDARDAGQRVLWRLHQHVYNGGQLTVGVQRHGHADAAVVPITTVAQRYLVEEQEREDDGDDYGDDIEDEDEDDEL